MRPPKDIWTNNYNDFILDLYDANPLVQKDNGTVKKAPEPEKNPKKVEATPEESDSTLTNLIGESLRLRNTAVLNLKLTKSIFKWEKERLAKIKPFPDSDPLDGKKVVIIEDDDDDDDDGFKFPRFKFPKLPKLPKIGKIPNPFKKPSPKTSPSVLPKTAPSPLPKKEKEKQPQLEFPRIPSIPFFPLPYLLPRFGEVAEVTPKKTPQIASPQTASPQTASPQTASVKVLVDVGRGTQTQELARTVEGGDMVVDDVGGGKSGNTPGGRSRNSLLENRPNPSDGQSSKSLKKIQKKGNANIDPSKLKLLADSAFPTSAQDMDIDDVGNKLYRQHYEGEDSEEVLEELKKLERKRRERNVAFSSKNKIQASDQENILKKILEDRAANRIVRDVPNGLPGTNPVTQSKLPINKTFSISKTPSNLLPGTNPFTQSKLPISNIKPTGGIGNFNQLPDLQKLLKSNTSFSFVDGLKIPKFNLTGRALFRSSLGALDAGLVGYDYVQRKSEGQTDLQAVAGAGSSYAGGVAAQVGTGALITKYGLASIVTPVPGARPVGLFLLLLGAGVAGGYFGGKVSDAVTGVDNPSVKEELNTNGVPVPEMDLTEELFSPEAIQQFEEMMKNIPNGGFAPQTPLLVPIPSFGNLSEFPSPSGNYNTWGHPTQGN